MMIQGMCYDSRDLHSQIILSHSKIFCLSVCLADLLVIFYFLCDSLPPFPSKPLRLTDGEIVEEEDDFDESDSETSLTSEADGDETSRNLNYEGLKQDHLVPVDLQMGHGTPEKDPVVYSLPARKLLIGNITDDIPENVKVVRIFTSSTFTGILINNNIWLSNCSSKHLQVETYRY